MEGIDGSGKSTTTREVAAALQDVGVTSASYKGVATTSVEIQSGMRQLNAILWPGDQAHLRHLPSRYRVLLHAAWASLLSEGVVQPALEDGRIFLFDGWCYKIMARFFVDGYPREYLNTLFSHVVEPDHVIMLDPDVESVWERGQEHGRKFSPVEMGLYQGYTELGKDTFVSYQSRTRDALLMFAKERNKNITLIKTNGSTEESCIKVEALIRQMLASQRDDAVTRNSLSVDRARQFPSPQET